VTVFLLTVRAGLEDYFASRSQTEVGIQVTVDLTHENATILMTKPFGHLSKRDAGHNTNAGEVMPHVVKSNPGAAVKPSLARRKMWHEIVQSYGGPH
jgi:hypothetical protein